MAWIACYKSAKYTVERPLQLGAAVAVDDEAFLSGYGLALGEAFQLRDDLLGVFGDPSVTGKPGGEDIREGKQTLLLVLGRQLAGPADRRVLDAAAGNPEATDEDIAEVRRVLIGCGALDVVERRITGLAGRAQAALGAEARVPAAAQAALLGLAWPRDLAGPLRWPGRPSSSAPGWPGWPRRSTWRPPGATSPWWKRAASPAAAAAPPPSAATASTPGPPC